MAITIIVRLTEAGHGMFGSKTLIFDIPDEIPLDKTAASLKNG